MSVWRLLTVSCSASQNRNPCFFSPNCYLPKERERSKCHGNTHLSHICKEVGVHVSLATTREHGDNHLTLVLFSRSDLMTHSKDHCMKLQAGKLKCEMKSQLARMCVWTFRQAARFAPEEMPTSKPSSLASLLAFTMASSVVTVTVSSMTEVSRTSGINPGPTPWILCLPGAPPEEYQCLSMCRYSFRVCDSYSKYCILLSHTAQESRLSKYYFELTAVSTFV